jgi:hypothetical protein
MVGIGMCLCKEFALFIEIRREWINPHLEVRLGEKLKVSYDQSNG